jgi:Holliday junction DNA helicase RuvA
MIAQLTGILAQKKADRVIIDIQGVGYEVLIPFSTYYELGGSGETVSLQIHTHVREDTLTLYGFRTAEEKRLFMELIQVSGIGPKLGVTILSGLPVDALVEAVSAADIGRLSSIPGVGKKTAERMVLEMKDKIPKLFPEMESAEVLGSGGILHQDVVSALVNLGYPKNKAEVAVSKVTKKEDVDRFDLLLKKALRELSG